MKRKIVSSLIGAGLLLAATSYADNSKKEIKCYWMGSSSSPPRLLKTFDEFVNAGEGFRTDGSVHGSGIRLDRMASGENEQVFKFNNFSPGEFDYVIAQVSSGFTRSPEAIENMESVISALCAEVRARKAEPVLWEAYAATPDNESGMTPVERQELLHKELIKAAAKNRAIFVPAGSAWQEVHQEHAEDRRYMFSEITPKDVGHTGPRGNFILGAAIYAAVTGENPMENPNTTTQEMDPSGEKNRLWNSSVPFAIDPAEAEHFKEIVWKHVLSSREEYQALSGKQNRSQSAASPAPSVAVTPEAQAQPDAGLLDIYLIMGEKARIEGEASDDRSVYVLDQATGLWQTLPQETGGDGGIGAALAAQSPGRQIGLIFCGVDDSGLSDWQEGEKNYNRAMILAQEAMLQGTLCGCMWVSRSGQIDEKEEAFQKMVNAFRKEVPSEDLPFSVIPEKGRAAGDYEQVNKKGGVVMKKKMMAAGLLIAGVAGHVLADDLLFDFGKPNLQTAGNWNNVVNNQTGVQIPDAVKSDGNPSGVSLSIVKPFSSKYSPGSQDRVSDELYPASAQQDYFASDDMACGEIQLSGLVPGNAYTFTFFASREKRDGKRVGKYTAGSSSTTLDAAKNTGEVAVIRDVTVDASGQVTINISNTMGGGYAYINVLQVTGTFARP